MAILFSVQKLRTISKAEPGNKGAMWDSHRVLLVISGYIDD